MTSFQRLIKYMAIALAVCIIVGIFAGAAGLIAGVSYIFTGDSASAEISDGEYIVESFDGKIENLNIDLLSASVKITSGDALSVQYNKSEIRVVKKKNTLRIKERSTTVLSREKSDIILTVPEDVILEKAKIDSGAGRIDISFLQCEKLDIDLGAGEMSAEKLTVSDKADVECGVGKVTVSESVLHNLDVDCGVGDFTVSGELSGKSDFDLGIGKTSIGLTGSLDSYTVTGETGLGIITVDGSVVKDSFTVGDGDNIINIDGGVGKAEIAFVK